MSDLISRQAAIDAICAVCGNDCDKSEFVYNAPQDEQVILCPEHYCLCTLPSAQSDYQEVLGWLLAYHTMSFDLHGRYLPHEVISWLINDFTKDFIAGRGQNG